MLKHYHFNPVANVKHARTEEEFLHAINMSKENDFLMHVEPIGDERPLRYITIERADIEEEEEEYYIPENWEYFYTQSLDGIITATLIIIPKNNAFQITNISTRQAHKCQGLAQSLIWSTMKYAQNENTMLTRLGFEEEGWEYLSHVYPRLHQDFPDLKIKHGENTPVDFSAPYRLERQESGDAKIVFV